jgi:nucleotide-binding universal stress UspA family protein
MIEVCVFTALLGLAMHALSGLQAGNGEVNAPSHPGVRDYMLRYMAEVFVGNSLGATVGHIAGWAVSIVFGFLLLSAVNTAIVALIAIQFLMSRDGEVPPIFQKLNSFGVPTLAMVSATVVPVALVLLVRDVAGLADLYAVGVVGAIAANLAACSTDRKLPLAKWERALMFGTFLVMLAIEVSLFVDKPNARVFAVTLLAAGLVLRGLVHERRQKQGRVAAGPKTASPAPASGVDGVVASGGPLLCAVRGINRTLEFAIKEAQETHRPLYVAFIREQPVLAEDDLARKWQDDDEAAQIFAYAKEKLGAQAFRPCYAVSDSPADTIVDIAATIGAERLILGTKRRSVLLNVLRGNIIRQVARLLPEQIDLLVYA